MNYREDRIRTCDPLVPNQVLYQAELLPDELITLKTEPNNVIVATSGCSDCVCRFLYLLDLPVSRGNSKINALIYGRETP